MVSLRGTHDGRDECERACSVANLGQALLAEGSGQAGPVGKMTGVRGNGKDPEGMGAWRARR